MYNIDKKFNNLVSDIESKSLDEIYSFIKGNFDRLKKEDQNWLIWYYQTFDYWGKIDKENDNYEELHNRALSLKNHINEYKKLYSKLGDYRSKRILYGVLNNWYRFDTITIKSCRENNFRPYFDLDIVKCNKNEVVVDLGAYTGDTARDYIESYGIDNYKRIYCYEMLLENYMTLIDATIKFKNIVRKNLAVSDKNEIVYINENSFSNSAGTISNKGDRKVEAVKLDDDIEEKITLLKMDIEGAEKKALIGAKEHIKNDRPKLLISVYHNHEDLYEVPNIINSIDKNYKYYLRYYGTLNFPTEILLIAIPRRK